ncbi:MAG: glycosyltransferase [Planctomycetes bacterium]|nr:glycosyltransferase [Planctomycetota bacterium]
MKLAHVVFCLGRDAGGIPRAALRLAEGQAALGERIDLLCCDEAGLYGPMMKPAEASIRALTAPSYRSTAFRLSIPRGLNAAFRECHAAGPPDIIHDHGAWMPIDHAAAVRARKWKVPLVVSPHGTLTGWALRFRRLKKRLAWAFYQKKDLGTAGALHCTSRQEADDLRRLGLKSPIALVELGFDMPPDNLSRPAGPTRTMLFLSNIIYKKGLENLVEAWAAARPDGWKVRVAGPADPACLTRVKRAISRHNLEGDFQFIGPVDGEEKWRTYAAADVFVLPSFTENFGLVVAEALACGLPVITTTGTPWRQISELGCGWLVEPAAGPLADAIRQATALPHERLVQMGSAGSQYVRRRFNWRQSAGKMIEVYKWLLGGPRPDCIID